MKKNITHTNKILLVVLMIAGLASCISPKQTNLLQPGEKPHYQVKAFEDYRFQINDEIFCNILTSDTEFANTFNGIVTTIGEGASAATQTSYVIYENGNVSIPFFGDVKIVGMTAREAESAILRRMRPSFPDAQVSVRLRNNQYFIVSANKNGVYNLLKDNMTIYQALSMSGNVSEDADLGKVKIIRTDEHGKSIIKVFNLRTESIAESEFYYIKPNDVIYYSTSNSSFFKVRSLTGLVTTIITPITFAISMFAFVK